MTDHRTTAQRGYGAAHDRLRKRWKPIVDAGEAICARCHQPIQPGTVLTWRCPACGQRWAWRNTWRGRRRMNRTKRDHGQR